jgi:hypothetical protein
LFNSCRSYWVCWWSECNYYSGHGGRAVWKNRNHQHIKQEYEKICADHKLLLNSEKTTYMQFHTPIRNIPWPFLNHKLDVLLNIVVRYVYDIDKFEHM